MKQTLHIHLETAGHPCAKTLVLSAQRTNSLRLHIDYQGDQQDHLGFIPGEPMPLNPMKRPNHSVLYLVGIDALLSPAEMATLHIEGWKTALFSGPQGHYLSLSPKYPFAVRPKLPVVRKGAVQICRTLDSHTVSLSLIYQGVIGVEDDTAGIQARIDRVDSAIESPYALSFA